MSKFISGCVHSMVTVFYHGKLCMKVLKCFRLFKQVWLVQNIQGDLPHWWMKGPLNKFVP